MLWAMLFWLVCGALAGCGGSGGASSSASSPSTASAPDFTLSVSPQSATLAGGESQPVTINVQATAGFSGSISLDASGVPAGVTVSPSLPATISAGTTSMTLSASATVAAGPSTIQFTGTSGSLSHSSSLTLSTMAATSRFTFHRLEGRQYHASGMPAGLVPAPQGIYDPLHRLFFMPNGGEGKLEVFAAGSGQLVREIPIPDALGADIALDDQAIYVCTTDSWIFVVDTATLQIVRRVRVPLIWAGPTSFDQSISLAVAGNGKVLILQSSSTEIRYRLIVWDPASGSFADRTESTQDPASPLSEIFGLRRSGDHSRVYLSVNREGVSGAAVYDSASDRISFYPGITLGEEFAVNRDGSQLATVIPLKGTQNELIVYDAALHPIQSVLLPATTVFAGGMVYSSDGTRLFFAHAMENARGPAIDIFDTSDYSLLGSIPDAGAEMVNGTADAGFPVAVDDTGLLMAFCGDGVVFVDTGKPLPLPQLPVQMWSANPDTGRAGEQVNILGTNLVAGTQVEFGGAAAATGQGGGTQIAAEVPAGPSGTVNLTAWTPDGWAGLLPDGFSYGPTVLWTEGSMGAPQGGSKLEIVGYGLDSSTQVMIGGSQAQVTNEGFSLSPFAFPDVHLSVTTPPGEPGPSDITIATSSGPLTLPHAFEYLPEVKVIPSASPFNTVVYDSTRQQAYFVGTGVVQVLDPETAEWKGPLAIPNLTPQTALVDAAMTPDGSRLLITDFTDGDLLAVDPDNPANTTRVHVLDGTASNGSLLGPVEVAALSGGRAFVGMTFNGSGCGGALEEVDLTTASVQTVAPGPCLTEQLLLSATPGGNHAVVVVGDNDPADAYVWSAQTGNFQHILQNGLAHDVAVAGGLSRIYQTDMLYDQQLSRLGKLVVSPLADHFGGLEEASAKFNASGSLIYIPRQTSIDIMDTNHLDVREEIGLTDAMVPGIRDMALDVAHHRMFLITASGATMVTLAREPLGIGSVNPEAGAAGTSVQISGSGFEPGSTVKLGGVDANAAISDDSTLTITVPALPKGPASLVVSNPDGSSYRLDDAFNVQ